MSMRVRRAISALVLVLMMVGVAACGPEATPTTGPGGTTGDATATTAGGGTGAEPTSTLPEKMGEPPAATMAGPESGGMTTSSGFPNKALQIMAPAAPGGGWDITARTVAQVLQEAKLLPVPVELYNKAGAGGTVGLGE